MTEPASDHRGLTDTHVSRRYFAKFDAIIAHLSRVAGLLHAEGRLSKDEVDVLARYVTGLNLTFRALSMKYMLVGRETGQVFGALTMDTHESGFPTATELMVMANDAAQAARHLETLPDAGTLKKRMVAEIIGEQSIPTRLQFTLSQRLYYEELLRGNLFWARNDPQCQWLGGTEERRRYLLHWAIYDTQMNLPTVYLMEVEDTGRDPLPRDQRRWPEAQAHLMAQSLSGLKLLTIAQGFDQTFDDLHPKRLRRFHIGPMYVHGFTHQSGPIREVLEQASAPDGQDWALVWTVEDLESEDVRQEKSGWFSTVEREMFALDPFSGRGAETGATRTERMIVMPERPFQVLAERNPPGFENVRKFVVSDAGPVLRY
ncbi:hypothetical protein [Marivita sp. S2033]|uniref:hypothetical protein n=1 Tax=Marivita sp. S2033 TaxID=3373187 RepID=UPI00398248F0